MITFNTLGRSGQLGNQMFQYALLLGVSSKTGLPITFTGSTKRNSYLFDFFDLQNYKIEEYNWTGSNTYSERTFEFDKEVYSVKTNTNFFGYFQSEKYFQHCENVVRREFSFKSDTKDVAINYLKTINEPTVAVHVRRGDYLNFPTIHPQQSVTDYYLKAMIECFGSDYTFIFVSDDIGWCKNTFSNINGINTKFFHHGITADMCLMGLCDHNIISNSTYSWWGSWLGYKEGKTIIAPDTWFGPDCEHVNHTSDLYSKYFTIL